MRRALPLWLIALLAVVALGLIGGLTLGHTRPDPHVSAALASRTPDAAHGAYIARLGDCAACHTPPGGAAFSGGVALQTPLGAVYASNITPDPDHGIGRYSFTDFARLMRLGVKPDGTRIYPAMPYTAYAKVSDEDLQDLFAYLRHGVTADATPTRPSRIAWPLSLRWPLAFWNMAFLDTRRFKLDPQRDAAWNRGAYLAQGLGHCGTCHTPRGIAFQEKTVDGASDLYLSGARLAGESPINLRGNLADGLGRWSADDIVQVLATGRSVHSAVVGQMAEVVSNSTRYMTPADLSALGTYLKSLSPAPQAGRATFAAGSATIDQVMAGRQTDPGGRMFMDSCAACHRLTGAGEDRILPTLAGAPTVLSQYPDTLVAVILKGARRPATAAAPSRPAMPPFDWRYSDREVASLATYVRRSWGNGASAVTEGQVRAVRHQLAMTEPRR